MKIGKEVRIGIYLVITIVVMYFTINFLKGKNVFGQSNVFYAVFEDVQGLRATSSVSMSGLRIGYVERITYNAEDRNFLVVLSVDSEYSVPLESVATIYSSDLLGSKALKIDFSKNTTVHKSGDTLVSGIEGDMLSSLVDQVGSTLTTVQNVLNDETVKNIGETFDNLNSLSAHLDKASQSIEQLLSQKKQTIANALSNIEDITVMLKSNEGNINNMLSNLSAVSDSLAHADFKGIADDLNSIVSSIKNGEGTVGKLLNDEALYTNLNNASIKLDALLNDLQKNPGRYVRFSVFGKSTN